MEIHTTVLLRAIWQNHGQKTLKASHAGYFMSIQLHQLTRLKKITTPTVVWIDDINSYPKQNIIFIQEKSMLPYPISIIPTSGSKHEK